MPSHSHPLSESPMSNQFPFTYQLTNLECQSVFTPGREDADRLAVLFSCLEDQVKEGTTVASFLQSYQDIDPEAVTIIELAVGVKAHGITDAILAFNPVIALLRILSWNSLRTRYMPDIARRMTEVIVRPTPVLSPAVKEGRLKESDPARIMEALAYVLFREARSVVYAFKDHQCVVIRDRCEFVASVFMGRVKEDGLCIHSGNWRELTLIIAGLQF